MTRAALIRYRVMAYVTGVLLLLLVFVAMPVKYVPALGGDGTLVRVIGTVHGWMYLLYLLAALTLAYRRRWSLGRAVLILLAGTVPFASFVAERAVTREVGARLEHVEPA